MLKKILALSLLVLSLVLFGKTNVFINEENKILVINGKSSGEFIKYADFKSYDGLFVNLDRDYNYKNLIKKYKASFVKSESASGVVSLYYYSKTLPKKEVIDGKLVNIHVAISNDKITIGTPIIYGGF